MKFNSEQKNDEPKNGWGLLIVAILLVVALWSLNWYLLWRYESDGAVRGQFGDMFGSVNALFSGLAFAFLIYTIWLQRKELELQREELKLQRKALEQQAHELTRQADELEKTNLLQKEGLDLQKRVQDRIAQEHERKKKAYFLQFGDIRINLTSRCEVILRLKNIGASASNLNFIATPVLRTVELLENRGIWARGPEESLPNLGHDEKVGLLWIFEDVSQIPEVFQIQITYFDLDGQKQLENLKMVSDKTASDFKNYLRVVDFT